MVLTKEQIDEEKKYLEEVIKIFDENYSEQINNFANIEDRAQKLMQYLSENKSQMDPGEMSTIMRAIDNLYTAGDVADKKYKLLRKVENSPYFARMDFEDYHYDELLKIYIGLTSIYKQDTNKYFVYDWRSPVASMYYDDAVGEASYVAPDGVIHGDIKLKRQYKIDNRKLELVFDSNINIDDELLKEALAKNTSAKMKNIVNSIQKEQNAVIRNEKDRVLIIDGPAGSGKTSVALHRIAFLLYRERDTLRADNIVILSPNEVFSEYISSVLPELGEDDVKYLTFSDYYFSNVTDYAKAQTFNEYIKNIYETKDSLELDSLKFKNSINFKRLLDEYFEEIEKSTKFKNIIFEDKTALSKETFENLYNKKYKKFKLAERMEHIIEQAILNIQDNLGLYDRARIKKGQISKVIRAQIKTKFKIETLYKNLFKNSTLINKHFANFKFKNTINDITAFILEGLKDKILRYDDLIAMTYLKMHLTSIAQEDAVKHLVVDEAQDYSILQYEILKETFNKAKFTILGDVNQAINPYLKYTNFEAIEGVFKKQDAKRFSLVNCYRNSYEIANFSNALLDLQNIKAMNRYEGLPEVYSNLTKDKIIDTIRASVIDMRAKGFKQIGIICKTSKEAKEVHELLKGGIDKLNYIDFNSDNYIEGASVLSSYSSKGLEFDAVISVHFKNDYIKEGEKHLLYVVFTRALHQLMVLNEDENLGLLSNIDKTLYEVK
ncbi:MAG: AAA family ATPase [Spirochaetales bacterium]